MNSPRQFPSFDASAPTSTANALVRRLGRRYLLVLAVVAGLMLVDQAIIQPLLVRMDSYAPVINLAGRQRMLSQKLAKAALAAESTFEAASREASRNELEDALAEWINANEALRQGSHRLGIPKIESPALAREWARLDRDFTPMARAARMIVDGEDSRSSAAATILAHESPFLNRMERIVGLLEFEAAQALSRLRIYSVGIAVAVIALLMLLGRFVVRPAIQAIRRQVDELDLRVSQRTRELADSIISLRHEASERKLAEARSQQLAAQLAHADRIASMGHLAVGLAHELNQPLGAIANYSAASEVLVARADRTIDQSRLKSYLEQIGQAAMRAGDIVRRIRKFVARQGDELNDASEVDLAALAREIMELCQFEIRRANVSTTMELGTRPAVVLADSIQVQQVMVNLVQNSLQSMQSIPSESRRLAIRLDVEDDWAEVSVVDSGPGFDAADLNAAFEPFHTTKIDGLGVGLSICRTIVESHGGSISIKPTRVGAHVAFRLPLAQSTIAAPLDESYHIATSDVVCR